MFAAFPSIAFSQDSFMEHFASSGEGATIINRGDFNNDAIPDIITGNHGGTSGFGVTVELGIGDGRFHNLLNSAFGIGVPDMTIADFKGDGKLGVALVGYTSSPTEEIQIMPGKGDGTFPKGQTISLASNLGGIAITTGDFN